MLSNQEYVAKHLKLIKRYWIQLGLADEQVLADLENLPQSNSNSGTNRVVLFNLLWGKYYLAEGELIKARRHYLAAEKEVQHDLKTTVLTIRKNDLYSYILLEVASYYRALYDYTHAKHYLNLAGLFAESEQIEMSVRSAQEVNRFHRFYNDVHQGDLNRLGEYLDYFRKHRIEMAMIYGLYNRFAINTDLGNYYDAYNDYFDGSALAESMGLDNYVSAFQMGLGYMCQKRQEYQDALKEYSAAAEVTQSWLRKSLCWENISTVFEHYRNYDKAIQYQLKSLEICEKYGVLSNIAADCFYIGKSYEHNFNDLKKAHFYYKRGHDFALKIQDEGVDLSAFNQKIITQYAEFITKYFTMETVIETCEDYLKYALNGTWKEIKDTFQYSLLIFHRAQSESSLMLMQKLDLKVSTLQAIQRRLIESGFDIPDFRYLHAKSKNYELDPGLECYIRQIEDLNWKEANERFEADVIPMLLKHYKNNKSILRDALKVSYATIISLTKPNNGDHPSLPKNDIEEIEETG